MTPQDVRNLPEAELPALAARVRERIVETVAANGGHLAASLGAVELAIALLRTFSPPDDSILWDVGHQAYAWKILTGRNEAFGSLRRHKGLSGFPDPAESPYDAFIAGHAGSALAAAAGMAAARDRLGGGHVVAVVGDASLENGESLEALRGCSALARKLVVVVNDNAVSPSMDVEAVVRAFDLRCTETVDGHDIKALTAALAAARDADGPVAVHVVTQKGKGFPPAEEDPSAWHGVGPFDLAKASARPPEPHRTWSDAFGEAMVAAARRDGKVCAVVAAMCHGTGLDAFAKEFPERFFDVGICEEMAVTFAAGLAKAGMRPVVAIYSTFLQRAVDQIQHDVCLQELPVVFAVDRAGCVGEDGATHHGMYDIPMLRPLPGMRIVAPTCEEDVGELLDEALTAEGPTAMRYPKGSIHLRAEIDAGMPVSGLSPSVTMLAVGDQVRKAIEVKRMLAAEGIQAEVIPVRSVKPAIVPGGSVRLVASLENGAVCGGFGESVGADMRFGWPESPVGHGSVDELEREFGFDAKTVFHAIAERVKNG